MLTWKELLSERRRKEKHDKPEDSGTASSRMEIERDYDRVLFASPTRRLADKTQVFPLEPNDSVRTRLTHSHEVANLCRSIGTRLVYDHREIFGDIDEDFLKRSVPSLLATIGLVHDLGNPPFGHQGEKAINRWFVEKKNEEPEIHDDFIYFDGNAHTIRLLTRLQVLNDGYGLNLTYSTLSALIKYPTFSDDRPYFNKHGVFESERDIVQDVWDETGLRSRVRHPLTYIMEACDDITYSVVDAEDTVKKGYASFDDLINFIEAKAEKSEGGDIPCERINRLLEKSRKKNSEFRKEDLSAKELNEISMQMFRVFSISLMVDSVVSCFVKNNDKFLNGIDDEYVEMIKMTDCAELCNILKKFHRRYRFSHREVLRLELRGAKLIDKALNYIWQAIEDYVGKKDNPMSAYVYSRISENYRRVFEATNKDLYSKCQLACDAISGMTDSYLIAFCEEIESLEAY